MLSARDVIEMLTSTFKWWRGRLNPARQQAKRLLVTCQSHGFRPTQINKLLPQQLRLPASCWSDPDQLQHHLTQAHIEWATDQFALETHWLDGTSDIGNRHVNSYKAPAKLHDWLHNERQKRDEAHIRFYFITQNAEPFGATSRGHFALILEQLMGAEDDGITRYYHLTVGSHFDHGPCLLHLSQILAIAHFYRLDMRRATLDKDNLYQLSHRHGLISDWLGRTKPNRLNADHEFWQHFSGSSTWLEQLRQECEESLLKAGLDEVVLSIRNDRIRFARPN